jgi:hypothetical protein
MYLTNTMYLLLAFPQVVQQLEMKPGEASHLSHYLAGDYGVGGCNWVRFMAPGDVVHAHRRAPAQSVLPGAYAAAVEAADACKKQKLANRRAARLLARFAAAGAAATSTTVDSDSKSEPALKKSRLTLTEVAGADVASKKLPADCTEAEQDAALAAYVAELPWQQQLTQKVAAPTVAPNPSSQSVPQQQQQQQQLMVISKDSGDSYSSMMQRRANKAPQSTEDKIRKHYALLSADSSEYLTPTLASVQQQ